MKKFLNIFRKRNESPLVAGELKYEKYQLRLSATFIEKIILLKNGSS